MLEKIEVIIEDELRQAFKNIKVVALAFTYLILMAFVIKYSSFFSLFTQFFLLGSKIDSAVMVPYYLSILTMPLLALLIGHDVISGELWGNSIRYIASRISRESILLGKFIAGCIIIIALNLICYAIIAIRNYYLTGNSIFGQFAYAFLYISLYAICFLSIGIFSSSVTNKPSTSLWLGLSIFAIGILMVMKDTLAAIVPFHYASNYLTGNAAEGAIALSAIAAVCLVVSLFYLRRKDL